METAERNQLSDAEFEIMRNVDLTVLITPYLAIGAVILFMLILIVMVKMPKSAGQSSGCSFFPTLKRIFSIRHYREGVVVQFFYVAACGFTLGVIFLQDIWGIYCLVAVSACMSLMFPTIYGIALQFR